MNQNDTMSYTRNKIRASSERILTALYLVTSLLNDSEPLKTKIRDTALRVHGHINTAQTSSIELSDINTAVVLIESVNSLIRVGQESFLISEMNGNILCSAFKKLSHELLKLSSSSFDESFTLLKAPLVESLGAISEGGERSPHTHHTSDGVSLNKIANRGVGAVKDTKVIQKDIKRTQHSRRDAVLKIVKEKGLVSIKDISLVITDCSEKTIQRELMALISEGVISKKGERRWSVYSTPS